MDLDPGRSAQVQGEVQSSQGPTERAQEGYQTNAQGDGGTQDQTNDIGQIRLKIWFREPDFRFFLPVAQMNEAVRGAGGAF